MSRRMTITAGCASLLAAAPLDPLFRMFSWQLYAIGPVVVVTAAALGARGLRAPVWAQLGAMAGAHVLLLSWLFGGATTILGIVPTPSTVAHFATLLRLAVSDAQKLAAPVPDTVGLLFAVAASIGAVAILIDMLAVGIGQPALAGLPMLAIYSVPVAVLPGSVSLLGFALSTAGFLWLLAAHHIEHVRRWGRRFTGDGRDVDPWEGSPLAAAGRRLGLVGIVAAVLIPLAAPGMSASFLENLISGAGFGGGGGGARSVDLMASLQGDLNRPSPKAMLRVRTKDERPGYLRLGVADRITERGALPSPLDRGQPLADGMKPDVGDAADVSVETARVRVLGLRQSRLPAYLHTTDVRMGGRDDWLFDPKTSVIWSNSPTETGLEYEMEYLNATFTPGQLRDAAALRRGHPAVRGYADVPDNQVVEDLVDGLTRGETNQYDKVLAIYNHFSRENGFTYSTQVTTGTSGSAVVDFLDNKKGYCQQYSVAMTWMVRAAGIPARVAIGFTQGAKNSRGYTITTSNAHAWVEVYFAGYGWVPFDPTPASGVNHEADLPWAPNPYEPRSDDPQAAPTPTSTVSPGPTSSGSDRRDPGEDLSAGGSGATEPPTRWPYWLLGGMAALALLLTPAAQRALRRRRRLREADRAGRAGGAAAYRAWDEFLDTLADLKIDYRSSDTPRGVARRVTHCRPPLIESTAAQIELIARSMERAEYSQRPLSSEGLADSVRAVTAELRANVTRPARATATLFPPSVLRDWQTSLSDAAQQVYAVWQRSRDAAAQRLLRRLRAGN